jgi:hypothetical protein
MNQHHSVHSPQLTCAIGLMLLALSNATSVGAQTLSPPTADPPGGSYATAQSVSLTAETQTTIRYTLDGNEPTESSALYSTPVAVPAGTTVLKARAFRAGWSASAIVEQSYVVDVTPPTISATVSPQPNSQGWNWSDVTITYTCSDDLETVTCPDPVTLTTEGAGQVVTRVALDAVGNETPLPVTINLDKSPASVELSAPQNGSTTSDTEIALTAAVSDALSGLVSATCNGTPAEIVSGAVQCAVGLKPGRNALTVQVKDAAGNSGSAGVRVTRTGTPTAVTVVPADTKLRIGDAKQLSAVGAFGRATTGVTWTSTDTAIASIDSDGRVVAEAVGEVTITASLGSVSAETTVTVEGVNWTPSAGEVKWRSPATSGMAATNTIYATRVGDDGPDLFAVETNPTSGDIAVRALGSDGVELWTEAAPGTPIFGDVYGGLVGGVLHEWGGWSSLKRFAGPAGASPWHYESRSFVQEPAQGSDGTIFVVERVLNIQDGVYVDDTESVLLGLDGNTGATKFRYPLPMGYHRERSSSSTEPCHGNREWRYSPEVSTPAVDEEGTAWVQLQVQEHLWNKTCGATGLESNDYRVELTNYLLGIGSSGNLVSSTVLFNGSVTLDNPLDSGGFWVQGYQYPEWNATNIGRVVPDGNGGVLATSTHIVDWWGVFGGTTAELSVQRIAGGSITYNQVLAEYTDTSLDWYTSPLVSVGDAGTAYVYKDETIHALNVSNGSTKWTVGNVGKPRLPLDWGGVLAHDESSGTVTTIDENGITDDTFATSLVNLQSVLGGQNSLHGMDPATGVVAEIAAVDFNESGFSYSLQGGNRQNRYDAKACGNLPQFETSWKNVGAGATYTFWFVGANWTNPQQRQGVEQATQLWSVANARTELNTSFVLAADEASAQISLRRAPVDPKIVNGEPVPVPAGILNGTTVVTSEGVLTAAGVAFNTDATILASDIGYRKAALHELGHLLGLEDNPEGNSRPSVMNNFGISANYPAPFNRMDDRGRRVSPEPTSCDRDKAKLSPTTPWPRNAAGNGL